ncbi:MAG: DEAD/DEAH box helicase, partial [Spirochaetales bacterium]|nr:DEAD/DEAH box helicase [Spirochaetales bacterium]
LIFLKKLKLNDSKFLVYDEIDRLSQAEERDFSTDLISLMPKDIQFIGCSATVTENAKKVFENALKNLKEDFQIDLITLPKENVLQEKITHWAIFAEQRDKIPTLKSIILAENPEKVLVFTGKLDQVENITQKLKYKKIECEGLHAKTDKVERKSIIDRFRSGKIKILVTSDLSARGLDFPNVTHVIQMDLPSNDDFFIHRAGRTGRANQSGINIVIGDAYEMRKYSRLEKKLKIKVYPKILRGGKIYSADYFQDEMNKKG